MEDEAEISLENRISVLQRTIEATRGSGGGQLLESNINKQIQRVRSELDSFQVPSRDSSVIRCSSSPQPGGRGEVTFGAVESCPHSHLDLHQEDSSSQQEVPPSRTQLGWAVQSQPPFQIFIDNPTEFYGLNPSQIARVQIVSTDQSELSEEVFSESESEDLEMAPPQPPDPEELSQEDKRAIRSKLMRLKTTIRTYDPGSHPGRDLIRNRDEWIGATRTVYENILDFAEEVSSKPDTTDGQEVTIQNHIDEASDTFKDFLTTFNEKCALSEATQPASQQESSSNHSLDSGGSAGMAERVRTAEVDLKINAEKVSTAVKNLKQEISKSEDWNAAESHEIELAMTKLDSWKSQIKYLKDRIWEMKRNVEIYGLDRTDLATATAAVETVEAEAVLAMNNIQHEDTERFLHSLNKSKAADLKYPTFGGQMDEDFTKFFKEFKNCLLANRIRAEDQVAKLREHLKGSTKTLIPATLKTVDEAFNILNPIYGHASRVMKSRKAKISALGMFPTSSQKTAANVRKQLEWYLALSTNLDELFALADESDELNREIYNMSTHDSILELFPMKMHEDLSNATGGSKAMIKYVHTYINQKMEKLQNQLKKLPDEVSTASKAKSNHNPKNVNLSNLVPNANQSFRPPQRWESCRICLVLDKEGKTAGLYENHTHDVAAGCPVFVAMDTAERFRYATKAKLCIFCLDADFVYRGRGTRHSTCIAFKKSCQFTCQGQNCKKHFLICSEHLQSNQERMERCKKFWESKGHSFSSNQVSPQKALSINSSSEDESESIPVPGSTPDDNIGLAPATPLRPSVIVSQSGEPSEGSLADSEARVDPQLICASEVLKQMAGEDTIVHDAPAGEPLFMFSQAVGKTKPVNCFYDNGCSHCMFRQDIVETELESVMIRKGPINISVAGDATVTVNNEYAVSMEKVDGTRQIIYGVSADSLTSEFVPISLKKAHSEILCNAPKHKQPRLKKIKVPKEAGGETHILLGIQFASLHPIIQHMLPSGLFIAKLQLKSHDGVTTGCIGGPHSSFTHLANQVGDSARLMKVFISSIKSYRKYGAPKVPAPLMSIEDDNFAKKMNNEEARDILGDEKLEHDEEVDALKVDGSVEVEVMKDFSIQCSRCGIQCMESSKMLLNSVKTDIGDYYMRVLTADFRNDPKDGLNDMKLLIKLMEQGVSIEYRCPKCRECQKCKSGPTAERISVREELEDEMIRENVKIDFEKKRIIATMPMRGDPNQYLSNNRDLCEKVLEAQCRKVEKDPEAKEFVLKAFEKLTKNKYAVKLSDLTQEQQERLLSKELQHWLPWRVVFKISVSTPCRCVFDASTKTPLQNSGKGGRCLNDVTVKGKVNSLNLINMLLRFVVGKVAINGDIRQFYNRIGLNEDQWNLQRVLFKEDLDVKNETVELLIVTLIYGVRCVSALSEAAVQELASTVTKSNPRLEAMLTEARFCDDVADSDFKQETIDKLKTDANNLFHSAGLECKGWSVSRENPPEEVSSDGISIDVGGMTWTPKVDCFSIKVPPIHFGKKARGRIKVGTEIFDGSFEDLYKFVPGGFTRRMVASKFLSFWDPLGKFCPVTAGLKIDMRAVVNKTTDWDDYIPSELKDKWIKNLWTIYKLQGIRFNRAIVPEDAADTNLEIIAASDAADVKVAVIYGRFRRKNGQYSCQHMIGRTLLAKTDSTIPKEELEGLTVCSNLLSIVRKALGDWLTDYIILSDSAISICWVMNEEKRLSIFHRNRVNQIKLNTDKAKLYYVRSEFNPGDIPSRPSRVQEKDVGPDSIWEKGFPWMHESLEKAMDNDVIKPASELKVDNHEEAEVDKGFILEKDLEVLVKGHSASPTEMISAHINRADKMAQRASFSEYIFLPKFSFGKVVRITSIVMKFISKLKENCKKERLKVWHKDKLLRMEEREKNLPKKIVSEFVGQTFNVKEKASTKFASSSEKIVTINEAEVKRAILYWVDKATWEVKSFNKKETIERLGFEKEGILFCRSRIMDGQRFLQTGEFGEENFGLDIGLNLLTPLVDRYSMIAMSIAIWIHHKVSDHAGYETCYRESLNYFHIIQGPSLFRELGEECAKCRRIRKKFLDVAMGPISDQQLTIAPSFYSAYVDLDGPYHVYAPGFERESRNRKSIAVKNWLMVFCCPVSKLINIQTIETKSAQGVMEGLTRMGCETGFPRFLILDKESSFMKVVKDAEISLEDVNLRSFKEFGIEFKAAPVGAHNFNGLAERKIRSVQESFEKMDLKSERIHSSGLQTLAKLVENKLNNLPLGYSFGRDATTSPLLKLLTPNLMRMGRINSRCMTGPVKMPRGPKEMMSKVERLYEAWFKIWNVAMVPKLIPQPKWFKSSPELKEDDVVYFQKVENDISSEWTIGQIESITRNKDKKIRRIDIRYFNSSQDVPRFTERSVRSIVRLFNIEDSYWVSDMEKVEFLIKELQNESESMTEEESRSQPLRVSVDNEGKDEIVDKNILARSCQCCCIPHCRQMHHTANKMVSGVNLSPHIVMPVSMEMPYTREKYEPGNSLIRPAISLESRDEMYEMLTALETDFNIL